MWIRFWWKDITDGRESLPNLNDSCLTNSDSPQKTNNTRTSGLCCYVMWYTGTGIKVPLLHKNSLSPCPGHKPKGARSGFIHNIGPYLPYYMASHNKISET